MKRLFENHFVLYLVSSNKYNEIHNKELITFYIMYWLYREVYVEDTSNTKLLCSEIVNHIKWKNHFKQGISKLSGRDYAVRSVAHISIVHTQTNVLCILSFCYKIWNNTGG